MKSPVRDKPVCIVTGGSSGIGRASCLRFAQAGCRVATCARDPKRLEDAVDKMHTELGCKNAITAYPCDVAQAKEVRSFVQSVIQEFGRVDVLVNNAGVAPRARIAEFAMDDLHLALGVNVLGAFSTVQSVWPAMEEQGSGVIINLSSMSAVSPFPGMGIYGSCKAWIESFTSAIAAEGKSLGIRAYAIRPGAVDTPMLQRLFPDFPVENRLSAEEVADLALQLCGGEFTHVSGQTFEIKK